eukprot:SAG11_NODE_4067_length_2081_cov_1.993946_3_plen_77_part_00
MAAIVKVAIAETYGLRVATSKVKNAAGKQIAKPVKMFATNPFCVIAQVQAERASPSGEYLVCTALPDLSPSGALRR